MTEIKINNKSKLPEWYKRIACEIGWHSDVYSNVTKDKRLVITYGTCKWCGYEGMVDSQGNLF